MANIKTSIVFRVKPKKDFITNDLLAQVIASGGTVRL